MGYTNTNLLKYSWCVTFSRIFFVIIIPVVFIELRLAEKGDTQKMCMILRAYKNIFHAFWKNISIGEKKERIIWLKSERFIQDGFYLILWPDNIQMMTHSRKWNSFFLDATNEWHGGVLFVKMVDATNETCSTFRSIPIPKNNLVSSDSFLTFQRSKHTYKESVCFGSLWKE